MTEHSEQVLVFSVAGRRCGVAALAVREIVRAAAVQPMPGAPRVVDGLCDVRGQIMPVISMRARLGLAEREVRSGDYFIIAQFGEKNMALRVDDVLNLVSVRLEDPAALGVDLPTASAIARISDGLILVHDVSASLGEQDRQLLDAMLSELPSSAEKGRSEGTSTPQAE